MAGGCSPAPLFSSPAERLVGHVGAPPLAAPSGAPGADGSGLPGGGSAAGVAGGGAKVGGGSDVVRAVEVTATMALLVVLVAGGGMALGVPLPASGRAGGWFDDGGGGVTHCVSAGSRAGGRVADGGGRGGLGGCGSPPHCHRPCWRRSAGRPCPPTGLDGRPGGSPFFTRGSDSHLQAMRSPARSFSTGPALGAGSAPMAAVGLQLKHPQQPWVVPQILAEWTSWPPLAPPAFIPPSRRLLSSPPLPGSQASASPPGGGALLLGRDRGVRQARGVAPATATVAAAATAPTVAGPTSTPHPPGT